MWKWDELENQHLDASWNVNFTTSTRWPSVSDLNVRFWWPCRKFLQKKSEKKKKQPNNVWHAGNWNLIFRREVFVGRKWSVYLNQLRDDTEPGNPKLIHTTPPPSCVLWTLENFQRRNNSTNVYQYLLAWYAYAHLVLYTLSFTHTSTHPHKIHSPSLYIRIQLNLYAPKNTGMFYMNVHSIIIYFPVHNNTSLENKMHLFPQFIFSHSRWFSLFLSFVHIQSIKWFEIFVSKFVCVCVRMLCTPYLIYWLVIKWKMFANTSSCSYNVEEIKKKKAIPISSI